MAYIALIFITAMFSPHVLSQDPTTASCGSRLLTLAPCSPFVQGLAQFPPQTCCDNLKQLYGQEPSCLCVLLNDNNTLVSAFPINRTLALKLPEICSLHADASMCSGSNSSVSPSPTSPIALGAKNNSTVAASPVVQVVPRPSIMGFGFGRSSGLETKIQLPVLAMAAILSTIFLV